MEKLTSADAGRILDVTSATVRYYEARGYLKAERTSSGVRLFNRAEVERFAENRKAISKR